MKSCHAGTYVDYQMGETHHNYDHNLKSKELGTMNHNFEGWKICCGWFTACHSESSNFSVFSVQNSTRPQFCQGHKASPYFKETKVYGKEDKDLRNGRQSLELGCLWELEPKFLACDTVCILYIRYIYTLYEHMTVYVCGCFNLQELLESPCVVWSSCILLPCLLVHSLSSNITTSLGPLSTSSL